jgi:hypothetical protein
MTANLASADVSILPALESNASAYDVKMRMCHGNGNMLAQK